MREGEAPEGRGQHDEPEQVEERIRVQQQAYLEHSR
jgi:hypothetical protein